MKTGAELICDERQRQVAEEGYDAAHDDGIAHAKGQLAMAACYYALPGYVYLPAIRREVRPDDLYPTNWGPEFAKRGPKERIRQLVVAGALIAAEIDRLQRAENDPAC